MNVRELHLLKSTSKIAHPPRHQGTKEHGDEEAKSVAGHHQGAVGEDQ